MSEANGKAEAKALKILKWPNDDQLHQVSVDVTKFDDSLKSLAFDMLYTMKQADGIGLAAPQVGEFINMIVIWLPIEEHMPLMIVNPNIITASDELMTFNEGCLSVPGYFEDRERPKQIVLQYHDISGVERHETEFTGLYAFAIQHEMDHLIGKLFIDNASMLKKAMIKSKMKKVAKRK